MESKITPNGTPKGPQKGGKWERLKQRFKDNPPTFKKYWLTNLYNQKFIIKVSSATVFLSIFMSMFLAGHLYSCILSYIIVGFISTS